MNYVNDVRDALATLSQHTKAGKKEGMISVDFFEYGKIVNSVREKYALYGRPEFDVNNYYNLQSDGTYLREIDNNKIIYSNGDDVIKSSDTLKKLLSDIKGIETKSSGTAGIVNGHLSDKYTVSVFSDDIYAFYSDYLFKKYNVEMLQTEFDLFKKAMDALEKRINTNLDELSKKYSTANANFDNFVKVVSSAMNTLSEMARGFLRY